MQNELNYDQYEKELSIDAANLDLEWLHQAGLFSKYSMLAAETAKELAEAKEDLKLTEAQCRVEVLKNPTKFLGDAKSNADNVSAAVLSHQDYQKAVDEKISADHRNDIARTALFAFQQRKDALENLVRLASMEYFSAPDTKRSLNREYTEQATHNTALGKVKASRRK